MSKQIADVMLNELDIESIEKPKRHKRDEVLHLGDDGELIPEEVSNQEVESTHYDV